MQNNITCNREQIATSKGRKQMNRKGFKNIYKKKSLWQYRTYYINGSYPCMNQPMHPAPENLTELNNVHDILSLFCDFDFDFDFIFFWKTQIDCPFEKGDNSCNLILFFANLSVNSLRVYVLFDLVTWPFWSDDNGVVWCLINPLKS